MSFYDQLIKKIAWLQFDIELRQETYSALGLLIDNQVQLNRATQMLVGVYSGHEPHPNHPIALALIDASKALEKGMTFSEGLKPWLPEEEFRLLYAGELSGQLSNSFKEIGTLIGLKSKISGALISGLAYPVLLFAMSGALLYIVATQVVPKLADIVSPEKWTGAAKVLYYVSWATTHYGLFFVAGLVLGIVVIVANFPRWTGKLRTYADRLPPWSIYRMIQGSSFLINLASLLRSGLQLNTALLQLSMHCSPWLKERINAIREELAKGRNFGEALMSCGYDFPDPKSNRFLAVISEYSGLSQAMKDVGERWLDENVKNIEYACNIASVIGMMIVGGVMVLVVLGASGFQDALQTASA